MVYTVRMTENHWRKINIGLFISIVIINLYTIVLPFLPTVQYWWNHRGDKPPVTVASVVKQQPPKTDSSSQPSPLPGNRLIIPRMDLNTEIIEGRESTWKANLSKGAWRLPFSSNPIKGNNTVIAGHRFTYTESRSIFYFLDKMRIGDEIGLQWGEKLYTYKVVSIRTVPSTEISVQQPTQDDRLTLYTCTPIFNPINRLVIVAKPISETIL